MLDWVDRGQNHVKRDTHETGFRTLAMGALQQHDNHVAEAVRRQQHALYVMTHVDHSRDLPGEMDRLARRSFSGLSKSS